MLGKSKCFFTHLFLFILTSDLVLVIVGPSNYFEVYSPYGHCQYELEPFPIFYANPVGKELTKISDWFLTDVPFKVNDDVDDNFLCSILLEDAPRIVES
jgi:hypothetical protein